MKTREEIEQEIQQEFVQNHEKIWERFHQKQAEAVMERDRAWTRSREEYIAKKAAALAELDDPMARLIAAARRTVGRHAALGSCGCEQCRELRDAIDYAEQRRAQG